MLDPVEPARAGETDAAGQAVTAEPAPKPGADLLETPVAELPAEPAPSTPDATAGDTSPKTGNA
jgi:hypothetical protein